MAILVEQALDLKGYAVQQLTLGTAGGAAGGLGFSPTDGLTQNVADGYPYWYDNALNAHPILPFYDYDTDPTGNGAVRAWDGIVTADTFVGYFQGNADTATEWLTATTLAISGKATAAAVTVNTGGTLTLNATALSVVPGDVALASGSFIVGNGSNVGAATAKNAIPISGFAAAAASVDFGNQRLIQVGYPVASTDGANKQYVLDQVSGVAPSEPARVATTAALSAYTPSGSPATLTANANGALTIDDVALSAGDRVLVKNESGANEKYNGLYEVTTAGTNDPGGAPWVLDRADDEDTDLEVTTGDEYFVVEGTVNGGSKWALATPEPITLGTTALTFVQTDGGQQYSAGNGLTQVGNVFHFATDAGYAQFGVAYAAGTTTMAVTAAGSANQVFRVPGAGGAPAFGAIDLDASAATTGTLGVARGGTNIGSYTVGDLLYASGVETLSTLAAVATGNVLISGGTDTAPSWGKVDLNNATSSTLTVPRGGTGTTTFTSRGLLIGAGTVAIGAIAAPAIGQIVMGDANASSLPKFSTVAGDLTATHSGGNAVFTIASGAVTFAKMQDISSGVVLGRTSALTGDVEEITFANLKTALNYDLSVTLTGDVTGSGTGTIATTISNLAFSKLASGSALSVLGVAGSSPASVASIVSPGANRVLRTASDGLSVGFGAINLSSSNAVSGVLNTGNGGTGVTTNLTFPGVSGAIPLIKTFNLTSGSSQYTIPHGLSTGIMVAMLRNSNGDMVWAEINTDPTNVVVTFGAPTVVGHTLVVVASDTV